MKKKSHPRLKTFNSNISLLKRKDAKLAYQIQIADPSQIEFCKDLNHQLNLKRIYQEQTYYYHSDEDVKKEAENWFATLQLENTSVLFVYGIGLGYYYEAAKAWLKQDKKRMLIFLEIDQAVIYRLLETRLGKTIIKDRQVQLMHINPKLEDQETLNELSWTYILCPYTISCLKLYEQADPEGYFEISHRLSHALVQKKILVDEYLLYGIPFLRNFYPNLFELPLSCSGNALFGKFKNTPAIICGAGPSLNKNIEFLKNLTNKALIFGGSSSLPALIVKHIIPHFGVAIDPNEAQLSRIESVKNHPIPFFYRNRFFHNALKILQGPRLYLTGAGGYSIAEWFEKELGISEEESLDEGHNVINFCLEIARELGCNPIILVGMDLALTNQQHYADGVVDTLKLTEADARDREDEDSELLLRKDIHGNPIYTYWKWITESEWIAEYAQLHQEKTFINATEGGIGFKGITNQSLEEVATQFLQGERQELKKLPKMIKEQTFSWIKQEKIESLLRIFKQSLIKCVENFEILVNEMDKMEQQIRKGIKIESLETPITIITENEIEQEVAQRYLLETFNLIFLRLHHRDISRLQGQTKKEMGQKILLQKERLHFLKDVAKINIELITHVLN